MSKYSPRALLAVSLAAALIGAALYERGLPAAADFSADDATATTALDPHRPQCDWTPPVTAETRIADTADEILSLVAGAAPGTTILIEDGEYQLPRTIEVTTPDVVIRSRGGDRAKVILRGAGMGERAVGVAVAIGASRVTIADLTLGYVGYHALQVRGERNVSDITLQNLRLIDSGQQLLKGSASKGGYADRVVVACSDLEYTTSAPSNYTNGVDVLGGQGWVVRDNRFLRIRGPEAEHWTAGPAILFWANAEDTLVERNLVIDSFRGIAFGLGPSSTDLTRPGDPGVDHSRGSIRNNVIVNLNAWADEGIEVNAARAFAIDHNTVLVRGTLPWSISIRFPQADGKVRNNLTTGPIILRDGGVAGRGGNIDAMRADWFVHAADNDFRLTQFGRPAIDAGMALDGIPEDYYLQPRRSGAAPDAGAVETQERSR